MDIGAVIEELAVVELTHELKGFKSGCRPGLRDEGRLHLRHRPGLGLGG